MSDEKKINIYYFGINQKLFEILFQDKTKNFDEKDITIIEKKLSVVKVEKGKDEWNSLIPFFNPFFKEYENIYWNAYKYPELLDNNYKKLLFDLYKRINSSNIKNIIIIKFGNSYIKEFGCIMNKVYNNKPFILFIFKKDETNPGEFKTFKRPEFISYMDYNDEDIDHNLNEISTKITSYILEKQNYFFELGKIHDLFIPKSFIECNILLIGEPGSGISSFINRIFNKLVSLENNTLLESTKKIKEFSYYCKDNENIKN